MDLNSWPHDLLTLDDWMALPEIPDRRLELDEGVIRVVPGNQSLHQRAVMNLAVQLRDQLPPELDFVYRMDVVLFDDGPATVRAPDLVVFPKGIVQGHEPYLHAKDMLLVIEVLAEGSRRLDRVTKFAEYADAGIPNYWMVQLESAAVFASYRLVEGEYKLDVEGAGTIELHSPVPVTLDLANMLV